MSTKTKHLVVTISGHGYGHAAMTAPLVNRLRQKHPQLKITLRSGVDPRFLQGKFQPPFEYRHDTFDFGMVMHNAFEIDLEESFRRYQAFHRNWQAQIKAEMAQLDSLKADFILSNIAYLPLAAARRLGLPGVAYSCLNWADIFSHYFGDEPRAASIRQQILEAYNSAELFIRSEPAMPMNDLAHVSVGPIATRGEERRAYLFDRLNLPQTGKLVLASMGGIDTDMSIHSWPAMEDVHYLLLDQPAPGRKDVSALTTASDISFTDALRSADLLLTKPGYGSFTEAAFNRTPVLFVSREEWPEQPYLRRWLETQLPCSEISREQLIRGDFYTEITALLAATVSPVAPASGLDDALALLEKSFRIK
jgi:hypothetical protein